MSICWFNNDYEHKYKCAYIIQTDGIKIDVEYSVETEVEAHDGLKVWSSGMSFADRDILIYDSEAKCAYLLKEAYYSGMHCRFGAFDGEEITTFVSHCYFKSHQVETLMQLPSTPKIKKIRALSRDIGKYYKHPSVCMSFSEDEISFVLTNNIKPETIWIGCNNIKQIAIGDTWKSEYGPLSVSIEMSGFIELTLYRKVNYTDVYEYVRELMIFLQLFCPGRFRFDKLDVVIEEKSFEFFTSLPEHEYTDKHVEYSSEIGLLEFLKNCYLKIPFRKNKDEFRNIPYAIMNTSRSIEDNFLVLYRFVECYYKRRKVNAFVKESLQKHYKNVSSFTDEEIENYVQEIVCLRNHYVHSGYYFKNSCLRIRFDKKKKDPRDYTVMVNYDWILERTKMLYSVVIDIIFTDMLGLEEYVFKKEI